MHSPLPIRPNIPLMRRLLLVASILVFIAGFQLFVLTEQTARFFAWTINPPLTAAFLGAGYWASFLLEYLASRKQLWSEARVAVPAVLLFTTLTLIATLLHLDKFHLDPASHETLTLGATWAWILVYALVPPLMFAILLVQLRVPGADPPSRQPLPPWIRWGLGVHGALMLLLGLALFLAPTQVAPLWPWTLSALTGRAVGAWLLGLGVAAAQVAWENDWPRAQIAMISYALFGLLQLIALARYPDTVGWGDPRTWLYLLYVLSALLIGGYGAWRAPEPAPLTQNG